MCVVFVRYGYSVLRRYWYVRVIKEKKCIIFLTSGKTTLLFAARTTRAALRKLMIKRLLRRFSLSRSFLFFVLREHPRRKIKDLCTSTPSVFSKGYPTATSNSYPSALLRTRPVYTAKSRECYPRNSVNRANQTPIFSRRFRSL